MTGLIILNKLSRVYNKYWWCISKPSKEIIPKESIVPYKIKIPKASPSSTDLDTKPIHKRKRRNTLPEIDKLIENLIDLIDKDILTNIEGKYDRYIVSDSNKLSRKSPYIGVSRNKDHWQVLINNKTSKLYIGTYMSEFEAAIAYDFYSIWLHSYKAKTNFSHNSQAILSMIENYKSHKNTFVPDRFIISIYK